MINSNIYRSHEITNMPANVSGAPARIWTRVGKIQLKKKSARSLEYFTELTEPRRLPPLEYFTEHTEPHRLPPLEYFTELTEPHRLPPSNILRNIRNLADYPLRIFYGTYGTSPTTPRIFYGTYGTSPTTPLEYFTEHTEPRRLPPSNILRNIRNLTDYPLEYFTEHTEPRRLPPSLEYFTEHTEPHRLPPSNLLEYYWKNVERTWKKRGGTISENYWDKIRNYRDSCPSS